MEWDPTQFFRTDKPPTPFALLVLNQPINEKAFKVLKDHGEPCLLALATYGMYILTEQPASLFAPTVAPTAYMT